ncbi:MAG: amino acid permease [Ferruginibacter sp.]|nr:amino acid permease [Ferruginibacter sp.]
MANEKTEEGLKRVIGVQGLALSIINGVIGAGIFALPGIVGTQLGAFSIFSYIACGIMLAALLLCYAEIGSRVTSSGGSYAYVDAAFGSLPGYIINWLYFFGWSVLGSAALLNVVADSLAGLFPVFGNHFVRGIFFLVLLGAIAWLNVLGAKQGIGFIKGITIIKLLPLLAIIIFGISKININNLHWDHTPSLKIFGSTTLILFFAFAGFETCLGVSGEFKNPKRTVPLGIMLGGMVVLIVYLLLQIVTQGILGADIAMFKTAPLAAVAEKIVGPLGATIILIVTAISCFGSVSADVMATPRSLFAVANEGLFPKLLGRVHAKFATPYLSIVLYATLIFLFAISGGFEKLANLATAAVLPVYLAVVLATVKLRIQKKNTTERSFQAPGGWLTPFIGAASVLWLFSSQENNVILSIIVFMVITCLFYFVTKLYNKRKAV